MRLSMHLLLLLVLLSSFGLSSCVLVQDVDETAAFKKQLQKKEWSLTRFIVNGNESEFTTLQFHFISDTEVEYTIQPNSTASPTTNTYDYEVSLSNNEAKFYVEIPEAFVLLTVLGITDDIMTVAGNSSNTTFFEFQ